MIKTSLFRKFLRIFIAGKRKAFGKNISAVEAINIQSEYYSASCSDDKLPDYPYVEIAKQLSSPKPEIFNAALYYLHQIAVNEPKNRAKIVDLLESITKNTKLNDEYKKQIMETVKKIKV